MSYKQFGFRSKEQWENWTRGDKNGSYYPRCNRREVERRRMKGRQDVRELKKASSRAQRIIGKRELRSEVEDLKHL